MINPGSSTPFDNKLNKVGPKQRQQFDNTLEDFKLLALQQLASAQEPEPVPVTPSLLDLLQNPLQAEEPSPLQNLRVPEAPIQEPVVQDEVQSPLVQPVDPVAPAESIPEVPQAEIPTPAPIVEPEQPINIKEVDNLRKLLKLQSDRRKDTREEAELNPFQLFEPTESRAGALDDLQRRDLAKKEAAFLEADALIDDSIRFIKEKGIPLTSYSPEGVEARQLQSSLLNIERQAQGAGANFTEKEMEIITDIIGTLSGVKAKFLGPEVAVENMERFRKLLTRRVSTKMVQQGFSPKRVQIEGPDGSVLEVDTIEALRLQQIAKDPEKWDRFIESLQEGE